MHYERQRESFTVSTDPARLDVAAITDFLANHSYWARGIPRDVAGSLAFGLYDADRQIGLARMITDRATFAYLCDVYVLDEYRGRGLGVWLVESVLGHPDLQGLRRFMLATRDAHTLYGRFGFAQPPDPTRWMEIARPDVYLARRDDA